MYKGEKMKIITIKRKIVFLILILFIITFTLLFYIFNIKNQKVIYESQNEEIVDEKLLDDISDEKICEDDESKPRAELLIEQYKRKKLIALTFDDGPSKYTSSLIDQLKKREIPVTFFVLGENVEKFPDTLKFAYDTGNEIGIHSYTHKLFTKLKEEEIYEQIEKTNTILNNLIDKVPTLIRVPYGTRDERIDKILSNVHLTDVLWSVDSKDWKLKNTNRIYQYVMKYIKGNDIILMHDTFKTSVEAAILIVDKLLSECYTFVTISEYIDTKEYVENISDITTLK
mgnify:FL=1